MTEIISGDNYLLVLDDVVEIDNNVNSIDVNKCLCNAASLLGKIFEHNNSYLQLKYMSECCTKNKTFNIDNNADLVTLFLMSRVKEIEDKYKVRAALSIYHRYLTLNSSIENIIKENDLDYRWTVLMNIS